MRFIVFASLVLCSTTAWAAPAARTDAEADEAAFKGQKGTTQLFDFENDTVTSNALKPDHEGVQSRTARKWESMIKVRAHFIPQMLQMAHDV
ncbi:hypothetical protein SAMN02745121_07846 [Nannocystis exedens]|uniref:Uncharacterized protein n=1 Tax=Nannocystis exedens TaxID=54 RepID=A0A1I2HB72_9BACT|nr:hypothetical protein [Nannocystis exedens]PCC70075.1 hypothetical protein NAEX_03108 [Nannocystis exedens]SFF26902.1 hypothetical protein SAMN02745121_07846 [Nannocystis exedens]